MRAPEDFYMVKSLVGLLFDWWWLRKGFKNKQDNSIKITSENRLHKLYNMEPYCFKTNASTILRPVDCGPPDGLRSCLLSIKWYVCCVIWLMWHCSLLILCGCWCPCPIGVAEAAVLISQELQSNQLNSNGSVWSARCCISRAQRQC